jgi:ATP diphosphatase
MADDRKLAHMQSTAIDRAVAIMARLRGPDGCPWDREQTFDSIRRHTLEETYEVFDAIERRAWPELKDELGDLLLQVLFYAQMSQEAGYFSIDDVAEGLCAKLIRRHPHIFGDATALTADDVKVTWEAVKQQERAAQADQTDESAQHRSAPLLDSVSRHQPAFLEAGKLGARAATAGFDWPEPQGLLDKLSEEAEEVSVELRAEPRDQARLEEELGDLLFTAVNLARHLKVEPEFALRRANAKFRARFGLMEMATGGPDHLKNATPKEQEALWADAKAAFARTKPTMMEPGF